LNKQSEFIDFPQTQEVDDLLSLRAKQVDIFQYTVDNPGKEAKFIY